MGDNGVDGGKCVLDAMVELGIQVPSGLFSLLALGDIDVNADHAFCAVGLVIFNVAARLDPPDRSAGEYNAKLGMMLSEQLGKYLLAVLQELRQVIWMDLGSPIANRDL